MKHVSLCKTIGAMVLLCVAQSAAFGEIQSASSIPAQDLVEPAELAALLRSGTAKAPLVLQVGFRTLYDQAHIPGSEYAGPGRSEEGLKALRDRVARLPKDTAIVLYCGCCPWSRCPNVAAAYNTVHELGFTKLKVLHIPDNFGSDWVDKGYPVTRGS